MELFKGIKTNDISTGRGRPVKYPFDQLEPGCMLKVNIQSEQSNTVNLRKVSSALSNYKKKNGLDWPSACRIADGYIAVYRLPEIVDRITKREKKAPPANDKREVRPGIMVSVKEDSALTAEFGKEITDSAYDFLSSYKVEKSYKTKSDYLTIRRWVIDAVKKQSNGKLINNQQPALGTSVERIDALKKW